VQLAVDDRFFWLKHGTTIRRRQGREIVSADFTRFGDDLGLVHANQGPQHGIAAGLFDHGHVVDGLARDLAEALAGDQGTAVAAAGHHARHALHGAAIENCAVRLRAVVANGLLHGREGNDVQLGDGLPRRQALGQTNDLLA
jgi:hypothetical protein